MFIPKIKPILTWEEAVRLQQYLKDRNKLISGLAMNLARNESVMQNFEMTSSLACEKFVDMVFNVAEELMDSSECILNTEMPDLNENLDLDKIHPDLASSLKAQLPDSIENRYEPYECYPEVLGAIRETQESMVTALAENRTADLDMLIKKLDDLHRILVEAMARG